MSAAVECFRSSVGQPEIVVAQTKDLATGDFFDHTDEDFRRVFQIFTVSFAALARAVIPDMRAAGWGRIVHIGSAIAKEPQRDLAHVLHNTDRKSTRLNSSH